jgi:hypothetical protein
MTEAATERVGETVDAIYRSGSRRAFATLVRLLAEKSRCRFWASSNDHGV